MSKYGNTEAGYDLAPYRVKPKWYQFPLFPLLPMFDTRKADEFNASSFSFAWLCFRLWSLEHFAFELGAEVEMTGVNIKIIFGWLRIVIRVLPLPHGWDDFLRRK